MESGGKVRFPQTSGPSPTARRPARALDRRGAPVGKRLTRAPASALRPPERPRSARAGPSLATVRFPETTRRCPPPLCLRAAALLLATLCALVAAPRASLAADPPEPAPYVPGEVVVAHESGAAPQVVHVADDSSVRETVAELRDDPDVE
jgi:hypothetical protein